MSKVFTVMCNGLGPEGELRVHADGYVTRETRVAHITEVTFLYALEKDSPALQGEQERMMLVAPWSIREDRPVRTTQVISTGMDSASVIAPASA